VTSKRWVATLPVAILVFVAVGVAVGCAVFADAGHPASWAIPSLIVATAASELAVVHFYVGRQRWTLSCTDALLTSVFVLAPGDWMLLAVPAGICVAQLVRRQPAEKLVFNVAQFAAATAAGVLVAHVALQGGQHRLLAAGLAVAAFWFVQTALVGAVVALTSGRRLHVVLLGSAPLALVHTAASVSVGLLAAWLAIHAAWGLLGLITPLVLLWASFDQSSQRAAEAGLYAELARGQEHAGGGSADVSAQVVLTAVARLLGGAEVEMLVFAGDGLLLYAGDENGVPTQARVGPGALDQPWVTEALAGGIVTGVQAGPEGTGETRAYCSLRIGTVDHPLALLRACRPHGVRGLHRHDLRMIRVLMREAESWLAVADLAASRDAAVVIAEAAGQNARVLGDLGAGTVPALAVLRESSGRLARLAQRGGDVAAVNGIVEELHTVERAVASLLGAIALAADTDLNISTVELAEGTPARPAASEWTSTGTIR